MKIFVMSVLFLASAATAESNPTGSAFDAHAAERFATLALACVHKEFPNHISHTLNNDADVGPPRKLTPAFYGCYDWHSSVLGHWLLGRLARTHPDAPFARPEREALQQSLAARTLHHEPAHPRSEGRQLVATGSLAGSE